MDEAHVELINTTNRYLAYMESDTRRKIRDIVRSLFTREDILAVCSIPGLTPCFTFSGRGFRSANHHKLYLKKESATTTTVTIVDGEDQPVLSYLYPDSAFDQ